MCELAGVNVCGLVGVGVCGLAVYERMNFEYRLAGVMDCAGVGACGLAGVLTAVRVD